jgi:hypothetical protein
MPLNWANVDFVRPEGLEPPAFWSVGPPRGMHHRPYLSIPAGQPLSGEHGRPYMTVVVGPIGNTFGKTETSAGRDLITLSHPRSTVDAYLLAPANQKVPANHGLSRMTAAEVSRIGLRTAGEPARQQGPRRCCPRVVGTSSGDAVAMVEKVTRSGSRSGRQRIGSAAVRRWSGPRRAGAASASVAAPRRSSTQAAPLT